MARFHTKGGHWFNKLNVLLLQFTVHCEDRKCDLQSTEKRCTGWWTNCFVLSITVSRAQNIVKLYTHPSHHIVW